MFHFQFNSNRPLAPECWKKPDCFLTLAVQVWLTFFYIENEWFLKLYKFSFYPYYILWMAYKALISRLIQGKISTAYLLFWLAALIVLDYDN